MDRERFQIVPTPAEPGTYGVFDNTAGRYVVQNESMTVCDNVLASLRGKTDGTGECDEIAEQYLSR